jgi:hypothetical protein
MSGLETKVDISLEDGALVLRLPAFERSARDLVREVLHGKQQLSLPEWMRNNLAPEDRLVVLELLDPPARGIVKEAVRVKAAQLPGVLDDANFTKAFENWVKQAIEVESHKPPKDTAGRLLWLVADEVRNFTRDYHPDLGPQDPPVEESLRFWSKVCKLVGFWVEEALDDAWEEYLKQHGREG